MVEMVAAAPSRAAAGRSLEEVDLSVVVPTRDEVENIRPLLRALESALDGVEAEVIVVDDSNDSTPAVVEAEAEVSEVLVRLCHRPLADRADGLGGAVKRGFEESRGRFVAVMDADLQHPPTLVPELLAAAEAEKADVVVASRFTAGGSAGAFGRARHVVSRASSTAARVLFPRKLRGVSDPMSGFFLVRRGSLPLKDLQPKGFKILLEVLVRGTFHRVAEVPYTFGERAAGTSKASLREGIRYLTHLLNLRVGRRPVRLAKFGLVGASGLLVNTLVLAALIEFEGVEYLASAIIATEISIAWNYGICELWVFGSRGGDGWLSRFVAFGVLNNAALAISVPLLWLLVSFAHVPYVTANLIAITALMFVRFAVSELVIWKRSQVRSVDDHLPEARSAAWVAAAPAR